MSVVHDGMKHGLAVLAYATTAENPYLKHVHSEPSAKCLVVCLVDFQI